MFSEGRICVACVNIAGTPGFDLVRDIFAAGFGEGIDNVKNTVAVAGAKIVCKYALLLGKLFNGFDMAFGKINDMDVISDSSAIRGIVVVSKNAQLC